MSNALTGLNQIPGVLGSAIFNAQDECVVHMMPPPFEPMLLGNVMGELRNALNVLTYLDDSGTWGAIVVRYDAGYLVVRQIHRMTVMVIAQPSLNPAMLSVGFNVAALKLEKEGLPPPPLPPPPLPPPRAPDRAERTTGQMSAASTMHGMGSPSGHMTGQMPIPAPPPLPPPPSYQSSPPATAHGSAGASSGNVSVSQSGGIPGISAVSQSSPRLASSSFSSFRSATDSNDTNPAVADAVGKNIMDGLLKALARHIGPFAKLIMKEELTKLGLTPATLGFGQYEDFVSLLSRRVQDPAKRREFVTEAEKLPSRR